jgi:hypothetical protein
MYIEFRGGLCDGKRIFLAISAESLIISEKDTFYHYRKTPRRFGETIIYQFLGTLHVENTPDEMPEMQS